MCSAFNSIFFADAGIHKQNYYATEFGFHFFREAFNESTQTTRFRVNVMAIRGKKLDLGVSETSGGGVPEKRQQKSKAIKAAALPVSIHEESFSFRRRQ